MKRSVLLLLSSVLGGCAGQIDAPPNESTSNIIGGVTDTGDPSVILIFAQQNGSNQGSLCTASVIAPTVLLTAAHCVDPAEVGANVTFSAFLGNDFNSNNGTWVAVQEVHHDPAFNGQSLDAGHDVGIVILKNPVGLTPLPYGHADPSGLAGQSVRLVGFGNNDGKAGTGAGLKRQVTTSLVDVSAKLLHIGDDAHETCQGDSGGPAFMRVNGVETIVGVTSFGYVGCTGGGYDTRVDLYASFIDPYVNAAGGGGGGGGCTPSCSGKSCGDDGCGGSCGACGTGQSCSGAGQCVGAAPTPPPPAACDWETEPNDSASQANAFCGDGHIYGVIDTATDVDWFTYAVAPNHDYTVTLSTLPADYAMTVYKLVNGALSVIGTPADNHDRADQSLARHTATGGTYYVKVSGVNGALSAQYGYTLNVLLQ